MILSSVLLVCIAGAVSKPMCNDCSKVNLQKGIDFLNTDGQHTHHATSVHECCSICQSEAGCQAFTFRTDQNVCYTKSDAANPVNDPMAISGNCGPPPPPPGYAPVCLGEFAPCPGGNHCAMGPCGSCKQGQYLCPSDQSSCIDGPADYATCPGIKGTHLDAALDIEARISYLLNATTLDEQIQQLQNKAPAIDHLGIPFYNWLNDDQHGVGRTSQKATVFPNGCGLGATFSKELLFSAGQVLGEEARGLHNFFLHNQSNRGGSCNGCGMTIYGPNLNLVKDPRWGRGQETFGEDPHLMSRLVVSWVTGAQNNTVGDSVGPDGKHLQSGLCCKHFAVYNIEDKPAQRTLFNANVTAQSMWETYMPAFEACIKEAKATHVMCSYNSVNGVPTCGNKGLLGEILREQWGFDGFVVSDYDAWANIKNTHNYVATMEDAAALGINAGLDQEGGGSQAINQLSQAITDGKTTKLAVATAFRRLFRVRIRLGMMDPPLSVRYNALNATEAQSAPHMEIALQTALASMTLLKNDNKALPLNKAELTVAPATAGAGAGVKPTVALIGVQATMAGLLMGNYAESASNGNWGTSVLDAVTAVVGQDAVVHANGCNDISCGSVDGFPAALVAAASAKVIVVMLGLDFFGGAADESEGHDRSTIELPGNQGALVAALRAANPKKTIIGLLVHGGTLALGTAGGQLDAIMSAWYPGIGGGPAIAQTLFGDSNPAGRTASTWYTSTSDLTPPEEQNESEGKGMTYRYIKDYKGAVVYPFGHGLSYTTFSYSKLTAASASVGACDTITLTVTVTNTGSVDGDEVIQAYAQTPEATVPTTRIRLVAFERVFIKAGASATVTLAVLPDSHSVVYPSADVYHDSRQVEAGKVVLSVGGGQPDYYTGGLATTVTVTGGKALNSC